VSPVEARLDEWSDAVEDFGLGRARPEDGVELEALREAVVVHDFHRAVGARRERDGLVQRPPAGPAPRHDADVAF